MSAAPAGIAELAAAVARGERRALARAVTLAESTRDVDREHAGQLLACVAGRAGGALRLGVSGAPGVGKSTFIESFGSCLADRGRKLAVLAVDPSSAAAAGAILGDKTRMADLTRRAEVFIRPSPAGAVLGGVARHTREAVLLCEAAGYDTVIVETVGVGQSEVAAAAVTDLLLLLLSPVAGDELQGIKRGVMELADVVAVNKADGETRTAATRTAAECRAALNLVRPRSRAWRAEVLTCSARSGEGLAAVEDAVARCHKALAESGELEQRRAAQREEWLWSEAAQTLLDALRRDKKAAALAPKLLRAVAAGDMTVTAAAGKLAGVKKCSAN